jgi:hypothetical protein
MNKNTFGKFYKTESEFQNIISLKNHKLYERFVPEKFANSGQDPKGKIIEFNNKDLIKPIKKPKIYIQEIDKKYQESNRWAVNTTKNCTNETNLPKLQNFKSYNFLKKNENEEKNLNYKKNFFKTDNISFGIPMSQTQNINKINPSYTIIESKSKIKIKFYLLKKKFIRKILQ